MTIEFSDITPEQCVLPERHLRHDIEYLPIGEGAWAEADSLWADGDGKLFINVQTLQVTPDEIDDPDDYVYVLHTSNGLIVSYAHALDVNGFWVESTTTVDEEALACSMPVCGFIIDEMTLDLVNNELLDDTHKKIPSHVR